MPTLTEAELAEIRARHEHDENYYAGKSSSEYPRHRMHLDRAKLLAHIDSPTAQFARKEEALKPVYPQSACAPVENVCGICGALPKEKCKFIANRRASSAMEDR